MPDAFATLRDHAKGIWRAGVAAVDPFALVRDALAEPPPGLRAAFEGASRILIVGGGKAGARMAAGAEVALAGRIDRVTGVVNVPADAARPLRRVWLHSARPAGVNEPTAEGVVGVRAMLDLLRGAGPEDFGLCLLSGGGSALLPAPADGLTLAEKQQVTRQLHACGATIGEMNCVRKHLSAVKGGRLAEAFLAGGPLGRTLWTLVLSDVVGDPLDVIASGPTVPDPTTFSEALNVLSRYRLTDEVPAAVHDRLRRGAAGSFPETPKVLPETTRATVVGNGGRALAAARRHAEKLGYRVVDLGAFVEGETRQVAVALSGVLRSIRADGRPVAPPACLLCGGETTVTLPAGHGRGGRNQEFVLAAVEKLGDVGLRDSVVLSGGTDGEDGPTDAAGAIADSATLASASALGLEPAKYLARHDAYSFFEATGDLFRTGLTGTNVMDLRVLLVASG